MRQASNSPSARTSDTKYLFRRDQTWWVKVAVPRTLRGKLGYDLRCSLRTTDLEVARQKRDAAVAEFRDIIANARACRDAGLNDKNPEPRDDGFFEIRFESIGGLGAHAAGQILARTAVLSMDLNGSHFSSYGSEKKGSGVKSFIRLGPSDKPIRTSAPIDSPNVVVVFHAALLDQPATLAGMKSGGTLIFNASSGELPKALEGLPKTVRVVRVNALKIAMEEHSRPNAVLLGTLTAVLPFLDQAAISEGLAQGFAHHADAVASNERAFRRGATEFRELEYVGQGEGDLPVMRPEPVWGYETAPMGGVLPNAGNTVWNDLTASRTGWIPVFNPDECIHCGLCVMVCPDYCLVWAREDVAQPDGEVIEFPRLQGVDYNYCKGCMRCIETCPTEAMHREAEEPGLADRLRVQLFPEIAARQREVEAND